MNNPLISIIIPVYNVEDYIRPCLDSILAQTYTNFEAILMDDGSKDGSGRICDEYAEKDSRFVVVHKDNEGVAKARITAFEHSKGELITFIDSDDYVSPLYLEELAKPIIEEDADMVSCDFYYDRSGKISKSTGFLTGMYEDDKLKDFITNHFFYDKTVNNYGMTCFLWTKMIKRKFVYEGLQNGIGLWYGEDQIGVFTMLLQCKKLSVIADRLYYYVQHEGQAMTKYDFSLWENIFNLMKKYEELDKEGISKKTRRQRFWLHINFTIFCKMLPNIHIRQEFCQQLHKARNNPFLIDYFKPLFITFVIKENVKYWILKLKMLSLFYLIFKKDYCGK